MTIEELNEKITKQQIQIDDLKSKVLSYASSVADINNSINTLSSRISHIENNGIKLAVCGLQEEVNLQKLKINKLDRARKGLV